MSKLLTVTFGAVSWSMNTCSAALNRIVKIGEMEAFYNGTSSVVVDGTVGKSAYSEAIDYASLTAQGSGKEWDKENWVECLSSSLDAVEADSEPEATEPEPEPTEPLTVKERAAAARAAGLVKPQEPEAVTEPEPEAAPKRARKARKVAA